MVTAMFGSAVFVGGIPPTLWVDSPRELVQLEGHSRRPIDRIGIKDIGGLRKSAIGLSCLSARYDKYAIATKVDINITR